MDPEREVVEIEADDKRWMMEMIMASRPSTEDATKHVYLAKWNFFSTNDNPWESFQNVNDNARGSMEDYYKNNPNTDNDKRYGARVLERKSRKRKQKNCIICLCLIYVWFISCYLSGYFLFCSLFNTEQLWGYRA
jgi:hypothetical protein